MPTHTRPRANALSLILLGIALVGCAADQAPTAQPSPSGPIATGARSPSPDPPTEAPTAIQATLRPPSPPTANLPIRDSARERSVDPPILAPGPDGGVYVLIPSRDSEPVLALIDRAGAARPGWPIVVPDTRSCGQLLPAPDGSVRLICVMANPDGNMFDPIGALAFDASAHPIEGWPAVFSDGFYVRGQVVGLDLTLVLARSLTDIDVDGQPSMDVGIITIASDGAVVNGERTSDIDHCCLWTVGPEGIAFGASGASYERPPTSRVTAIGGTGLLSGWPIEVPGVASVPAFAPGGRPVVTLALDASRSRVVTIDRGGPTVAVTSAELRLASVNDFEGEVGGCATSVPGPPLIASDGTIVLTSDLTDEVLALTSSLAPLTGWPFVPSAPVVRPRAGLPSEQEAGYCPAQAIPALGPDGTMYLALEEASASVGGSLVAVGRDGALRSGWPVDLSRPGAEFWSVVAGTDGTVFALVVEPEAGRSSSATVLAITPDSTVRWATTIIDP